MAPLKLRLGSGIASDIRARLAVYPSDWTDGLHPRILPATVFIFTANLLPAIAFSSFMFSATNGEYGTTEVVLSTAICNLIWAVFAGQPMVIMGVTGPVALLTATIYGVCVKYSVVFLPFMFWSHAWAAVFHIILSITNACSIVKHTTRFTCETFEVLIATVYIVKGIEEITETPLSTPDSQKMSLHLLGVLLGLGTLLVMQFLSTARRWILFRNWTRAILADYCAPLTVILFTCLTLIPTLKDVGVPTLPAPPRFETSSGRAWLVEFWTLPVGWIFAAIVPGLILTCLFFFDHNVSAIMAQSPVFGLKKPTAYHYDFFVLGIATLICGFLGIPAGNGLIPQAPLHTKSLAKPISHSKLHHPAATNPPTAHTFTDPLTPPLAPPTGAHTPTPTTTSTPPAEYTDVLEQRLSNLLQSLLTLLFLTRPFLTALRAVPRPVLGGLFLFMGLGALSANTFFSRIVLLCTDPRLVPSRYEAAFGRWGKRTVNLFTLMQVAITAVTYWLSERAPTGVGLLFPLVILGLVPVRRWVLPRWFGKEVVEWLDDVGGDVGGNVGNAGGDEEEDWARREAVRHVEMEMGVGGKDDGGTGRHRARGDGGHDGDDGRVRSVGGA
ncbi:HCO3 transporter family-domain-containing protein [Fimicolochytrium jonesii]|uniref:HCO3 transporter family-domain-containing protein n=1 Tax=Fimicolochytrium jonesii TaxID=1396493 RepID=UPI0022FDE311|nr:HCO3 transporter family-domain-containing protein [Fimicolochytrium jonesii]KAI8826776.1 HCO3 transporter family-domain-containing protein [Fimicolochytrium jonesii]